MQRRAKIDSRGDAVRRGGVVSPRPGKDDILDAMAAPDPMTTGLTPEGLADLAAADLEEARPGADDREPEVEADAVPPNPYRKQPE